MLHRNREKHQDDPQPIARDVSTRRYQIREKLLSIGDDYWIENDAGQKVFKVDGKALRIRKTLVFEDTQGNTLAKIHERLLRIRTTMEVEGPGGEQAALVKKALISPLRDRWTVNIKNGPDLDVKGNILNHEYTIVAGDHKVAEVSKKWFRMRDTYGVAIEPGQDDVIILAVTACLDQMAHDR